MHSHLLVFYCFATDLTIPWSIVGAARFHGTPHILTFNQQVVIYIHSLILRESHDIFPPSPLPPRPFKIFAWSLDCLLDQTSPQHSPRTVASRV
ncbi:hypothetical protein F4680DRAFT_200118 [Xylaria scruposa]|nr:hypothetical protein F4680DRAFT_200118 [Xylaria scruposa]